MRHDRVTELPGSTFKSFSKLFTFGNTYFFFQFGNFRLHLLHLRSKPLHNVSNVFITVTFASMCVHFNEKSPNKLEQCHHFQPACAAQASCLTLIRCFAFPSHHLQLDELLCLSDSATWEAIQTERTAVDWNPPLAECKWGRRGLIYISICRWHNAQVSWRFACF